MTHHFPIVPTQEELDATERREREEDRRRMGAVVWVLVTLPAYVVLIFLGLKWAWGM